MRNKSILAGFIFATLSLTCVASDKVKWGYEGNIGPEHWGDLSPLFSLCKTGELQAPINIPSASAKKTSEKIRLEYLASSAKIVNNGHTIQVNLNEGGQAYFGKTNYKILQFHMHTPSEEKIDGQGYPLNAHLVHINPGDSPDDSEDGKIAVIGLFFKEGNENPTLKPILDNMPTSAGNIDLPTKLDLTKLLPNDLAYYGYAGSLTTPGCSEDGVNFYILKTPVEMSTAQLNQFKSIFPMNARPVLPLNGRPIKEGD